MKAPSSKLKIVSIAALLIGLSGDLWAQGPCGGKPCKVKNSTLTMAVAKRILLRDINNASVDNTMLTCRACYSPDDKEENEEFVVVSEYPNLNELLARSGYIRRSAGGQEVFTAKAKRSKYFEAWGNDEGGLGGAGFRFANFRNPIITATTIVDSKRVPIEYDLVPTDVTMQFFGKVQRVQSFASFSYENRRWSVCIGCGN